VVPPLCRRSAAAPPIPAGTAPDRATNPDVRRLSSIRHRREFWRSDREAFLTLIELATEGTLVDDFGDVDYAPRRIPGTALKRLAKTRRGEAWRTARRGRGRP
jgi:hypothetical protein